MASSTEQPERTPKFYESIMQRDQEFILDQAAQISLLTADNNRLRKKLDNRRKKPS